MTKNFVSEVTENKSLMMRRGYKTPEVKVLTFQPEGVLCSSVYNNHQGFGYDEVENL